VNANKHTAVLIKHFTAEERTSDVTYYDFEKELNENANRGFYFISRRVMHLFRSIK